MKLLDQKNSKVKVETIPVKEQKNLKLTCKPRKDWETAFKRMRKENEDCLLIDDFFEDEIVEDSELLTP
jgi:antitoxin MazE